MLNGLHIAAAGMTSSQKKLDGLAGDIANVNTPGYRPQRLAFRELMYNAAGPGAAAGVLTGAGSAVEWLGPASAQGAIQQTGRALDVAIEGPGFLPVRRADGSTALTRAGALDVTADGRLVTRTGEELQPPVRLPKGVTASDVAIGRDGAVSAAGKVIGRIGLVEVPVPSGLQPIGDGFLAATPASGQPKPVAAAATALTPGALEQSGVDLGEAMVDLIGAQKTFSLSSRAFQSQDEMMRIANGVKR